MNREPFGDLRPPKAPPALRQRVLQAAHRAARAEPEPSLTERLWRSRPLRLAWAAAVVLLLSAHLSLQFSHGEAPREAVGNGFASEIGLAGGVQPRGATTLADTSTNDLLEELGV